MTPLDAMLICSPFYALVASFAVVIGRENAGDRTTAARRTLLGIVWPVWILIGLWHLFRYIVPGLIIDAQILPERGRREIGTDDPARWVEKPGRLRRLRRKR